MRNNEVKHTLITMFGNKWTFLLSALMIYCFTFAATAQPEKTNEEPALEKDDHWMQGLHDTVSNSVYQSAQWFDSFFIANDSEQQAPTTSAKIRLAWLPKSRDWRKLEMRFRVKVKLPHFQDKVSLIMSDESEESFNNLPLESANSNPSIEDEKFSLALNYSEKKTKTRRIDYRVGISGGDIFVKARHKELFSVKDAHGFLIEPSIYYYLGDGLGSKLLLEYNYQIDPKSQFRLNYSIRGSEAFSGIRWKHGFYKLDQLDQTTATVISLQVEGERNGKRGFIVDNYTLGYRYRFNALREWLFFEVEPFVEFPEQENYKTTPGIALRVEGFFQKK